MKVFSLSAAFGPQYYTRSRLAGLIDLGLVNASPCL